MSKTNQHLRLKEQVNLQHNGCVCSSLTQHWIERNPAFSESRRYQNQPSPFALLLFSSQSWKSNRNIKEISFVIFFIPLCCKFRTICAITKLYLARC